MMAGFPREPRADHDLPFLLRYENAAWYEDGAVRILDRRVYPARTEFVICHTRPLPIW